MPYVHRIYRFVLPSFSGFADKRPWTVLRHGVPMSGAPAPRDTNEIPESPEGAAIAISFALYEAWRATLEQAVIDTYIRLEGARKTGAPQAALLQAVADHEQAQERVWTPERTMLIRARVAS